MVRSVGRAIKRGCEMEGGAPGMRIVMMLRPGLTYCNLGLEFGVLRLDQYRRLLVLQVETQNDLEQLPWSIRNFKFRRC